MNRPSVWALCLVSAVVFSTTSFAQQPAQPAAPPAAAGWTVPPWQYATLSEFSTPAIGMFAVAWKSPGTDAVIANSKANCGNAMADVYKQITHADPPTGYPGCTIAAMLDYAGGQGWELATTVREDEPAGPSVTYIFKRTPH